MTKKTFLLLWLVLITLPQIIKAQVNYHATFENNYIIKNVTLDDKNEYSRIEFEGLSNQHEIGHPCLPVKLIRLIIPHDCDASTIDVLNTSSEIVELKSDIEPGQPDIPTSTEPQSVIFEPKNNDIYNSDKPYPEEIAKIVHQDYFRGNRIVTVAIYPFQYTPKENTLQFYSEISLNLNYTSSDKTGKTPRVKSINYDKILNSIVSNKDDIKRFDAFNYTLSNEEDELKSAQMTYHCCEYVIVTSSSLASSFDDFIAWKRKKGIDIELTTIEDIITGQPNGDLISGIADSAGSVRNYLANEFEGGLDYALLAGIPSIVPIRIGYTSNTYSSNYYRVPTDLYFSEFDGDWNDDYNNDDRYGEPGDDVDYCPEIFVGRIQVSSSAEIATWTNKTILYESNPGNGSYSYLTRGFFTEADEMQQNNWAYWINYYANWLSNNTIWREQGGYCTETTPSFPTGADIISEFNSTHYGFCSFMAHGNQVGISVATDSINDCDKFCVTDLDSDLGSGCGISESGNGFSNMSNTLFPSIYYSISCTTMPFDFVQGVNHHMGRTYTSGISGGGPIYIGNTRDGKINNSYFLFENFLGQINSGNYHLGIAEALSKYNFSDNYLSYSSNLMGCPETEIWTDTPSEFTSVYINEYNQDVYVSTGGIYNCNICCCSPDDNGATYFQVARNVSSANFTSVPSGYHIMITKHNYIPYCYLDESKNADLEFGNEDNNTDIEARLDINIPNPFSDFTKISCYIPYECSNASILLYNTEGIKLYDIPVKGYGEQKIIISSNGLKPGTYFYTLIANGERIDTKKMIVNK